MKFLRVLVLAALAAGPASAEPFRFVQVSDTHQGRPIHQYRYRQAIGQINALPFDVDVVAHTGDIVSAGFKSHNVAGAASNLFAQIRWPRICCPGNHDLRFDRASDAWTNRYYRAAAVYQTFFGPLVQTHETTNALYVAIDTEEIRQPAAPRLPGFDPLAASRRRSPPRRRRSPSSSSRTSPTATTTSWASTRPAGPARRAASPGAPSSRAIPT